MSSARTGRRLSSGGFRPFREDLVAWPVTEEPSGVVSIVGLSEEDVRAELLEAKAELDALRARVEALTVENERLRRHDG